MASTYAKRLAKLEELLASRINQPLAYLWLNDGESQEKCCIRAGYDPSQADRIRFVRRLTPDEVAVAPPFLAWEQTNEPGPPNEQGHTPHDVATTDPVLPDPDPRTDAVRDVEAETRYREAIERREAEIITEKLQAAAKAFAKTIV